MYHPALMISEIAYSKILRWLVVVGFSLLTTSALLWCMQRLIFSDQVSLLEITDYPVPDPVYLPRTIEDQKPLPKPVRPKNLAVPQPPLFAEVIEPGSNSLGRLQPIIDKPDVGGELAFSSSEPVPSVRVPPQYPTSAARRGVEGYVDLQFDVSTTGATDNIIVLAANPQGVFEKAAVKAVARWKYTPIQQAGTPIVYHGLRHRLTFALDGN